VWQRVLVEPASQLMQKTKAHVLDNPDDHHELIGIAMLQSVAIRMLMQGVTL